MIIGYTGTSTDYVQWDKYSTNTISSTDYVTTSTASVTDDYYYSNPLKHFDEKIDRNASLTFLSSYALRFLSEIQTSKKEKQDVIQAISRRKIPTRRAMTKGLLYRNCDTRVI